MSHLARRVHVCLPSNLFGSISQLLLRGSVKKLRADDGLMIFAMVGRLVRPPRFPLCLSCLTRNRNQMTYTVVIVGINIVSNTASNLIDPSEHVMLTPEELRRRRFGSKMVLVVEQMQITTVWLVKTCFLIMYYRLT
jgi:hypothetical protein